MWRLAVLALVGCGAAEAPECDPVFQFDAWKDADGDGAGDPATKQKVCTLESGWLTNGDDCDDTDAGISPYAAEICDGIDQDCDGTPDDGLTGGTWWTDADGDGYGSPDGEVKACAQPPDTADNDVDCDDSRADANPLATEVCNGFDDDCDTQVDDDDPTLDTSTASLFYTDADHDGFGSLASEISACANPDPGHLVDVAGDCDDADSDRRPGANEVCNGLDDNCDSLIDDDDPLLDWSTADTFFEDQDGDGKGNSSSTMEACFLPDGYAYVGGDCNDAEPLITDPETWLYDGDGDGIGAGAPVGGLSCTPPYGGTVPEAGGQDCDDANNAIYPGATEICGDLVDSDCDGDDCFNWSEDFESSQSLPVEFASGGDKPFDVTKNDAHAGLQSAVSGPIGNNQNSKLTITLDFVNDGSVTFWHHGDTEASFDVFTFSIDGKQELEKSGSWGWQKETFNVLAGPHDLEWIYDKDSSVSSGLDSVWIDDVSADGGAP